MISTTLPRTREVIWHGTPVRSWRRFHRLVKQPGRPLLATLDSYRDSVLVAGCQRSGTTAFTRLLKRSAAFDDFRFGPDDELDGALLLAGWAELPLGGRQCFQTTYLNDRYCEYAEHEDFRLVWILREPKAVVRSMLYNWKRDALNRLFDACGRGDAGDVSQRPRLTDRVGMSRLDKACVAYAAKTEQTFELRRQLGSRMLVVDYDELVRRQQSLLPRLCRLLDVPFEASLLGYLQSSSRPRGRQLAPYAAARVDDLCAAVYERARACRTIGGDDV